MLEKTLADLIRFAAMLQVDSWQRACRRIDGQGGGDDGCCGLGCNCRIKGSYR